MNSNKTDNYHCPIPLIILSLLNQYSATMKNVKFYKISFVIFIIAAMFFFSRCGDDPYDIIVCNSCPSSKPWSLWSIDLRHPCFETKSECQTWAEGQYFDPECQICNK
jgi:hypothetical protein